MNLISIYNSNNTLNRNIVIILVLVLQNIFIFYKHYFLGYGVPYDFLNTYLAVPYYWIEAVKQHIDVAWIPFQGMGYPLHMNLQSGYFYPPNWLFVFFNIDYTVTAAVYFQDIHILWGAIGAIVASKYFNMSWKESLLIGILYQSFGGFYSNASHVDIVRAYAYLPWIIGPILGSWKYNKFLFYNTLLLPLWVYCLWTGGYLGISIAISFVLGIVLVIRIMFESKNRLIGIIVLVLLIIGMISIAIAYLPTILQINELTRTQETLNYDYFQFLDIFSFIYGINYPSLPHDITMRSTSVGLITVTLLLFSIKNILYWNKWLLLTLILSSLMATGYLHSYLISFIPQLGLSRFIMGDYRGIIALCLILLSVNNLKYVQKNINLSLYVLITLLLIIIFGNFYLQLNSLDKMKDVELITTFVFIIVLILQMLRTKLAGYIIIPLIIFSFLDWQRIHGSSYYFNVPNVLNIIENTYGKYKNSYNHLHSIFNFPPATRPERQDIPSPDMKAFKGYYTGEYLMNDYGGSEKLNKYQVIRTTPKLHEFAMLKWTVILSTNGEHLPETKQQTPIENVTSINYTTTKINYNVKLKKPTKIIENEMYWDGWKMNISYPSGKTITLSPINIDGFRAWELPSGNYTMTAKFENRYKKLAFFITTFSILIWVLLLLIIYKQKRFLKC